MPAAQSQTVRGAEIIAAIKRSGISTIVALPDIVTSEHLLWPISRDPELRLIRVCKEDEGVSICSGLGYAGVPAMLLMQHTGLMDSLNCIRGVAMEYEFGLCSIVGLQGIEPDRTPAQSDKYGVRIVEPVLDAMGIQHARLTLRGDEAHIPTAFQHARSSKRPFIFLVARSPE